MPENNRFKYSNFDEVFGELLNVYRVKRGLSEKIFVPAVLFFLIPFGVITYIASEDKWTIPFCIGIPVLMFLMVVWQLFSTRRDELRIYENGFTYKTRKDLQVCLWTEIASYEHRERQGREFTELADGIFPLGAVEKKNGELIAFDFNLSGTPEIVVNFEQCRKKRK